jgi:hypothetical protein
MRKRGDAAILTGECARALLILALLLLVGRLALAQERGQPPLRLEGMAPGGVRTSATESWGAYDFELINTTEVDRLARVLFFYDGQPDVQYGREVWTPAHSTLTSWLLAGPAAPQQATSTRGLQVLLYDHTDGPERLVLPPGQDRIRSRGVVYRKREPTTAVVLDRKATADSSYGRLPQPDSAAVEAVRLVRTSRAAAKLSESVQSVSALQLHPTPEAFAGIDHLVFASGRLAGDSAGMQAVRQWVERGGRAWVMLDKVEPDAIAPLLGDALDFQLVDRLSLTTFQVQTHPPGRGMIQPPPQEHERPVEFARVMLPPNERVRHTIDGWPVWFTRAVGRGKIMFTTLGPRGWFRSRAAADGPSPYASHPRLPVSLPHLEVLAGELHSAEGEDHFPVEAFRPALQQEIGFASISRETVALVFAGFMLGALALGLLVLRTHRMQLLGWLAPVAAVGVACAFFALGERSRQAAAPAVAVAQVVDSVAGNEEVSVHGLLAAYRPDSGPADVGAARGGHFDIDMSGIGGQARRYLRTDLDAWHWDNLTLPAGIRLGRFHCTAATSQPIRALARLGPDGLEGQISAGPFTNLDDALLSSPGGRNLAVRLRDNRRFTLSNSDILPGGQFLASAVLSDQQQRRQELYRQFLTRPRSDRGDFRPILLAWAAPIDLRFQIVSGGRMVGAALLAVPLEIEPAASGAQITIPGPIIPWRRVIPGGLGRAVRESDQGIEQELRFQMPAAALPLTIERATLSAKVEAPSRRVTFASRDGDKFRELLAIESPLDPIRVEISDARLLRLDAEGGLHIQITLGQALRSDAVAGGVPDKWRIDYIELEIAGRTE